MKTTKPLLSTALALAFTGSAAAADVEMYGLINVGMSYVHTDHDNGTSGTNRFSMENAQEFGSRWGLRGSEDLANGYKVSFILETGFQADDGALDVKQGADRLFGRESSVSLHTPYGTFSAGLIPIYGSVLSTNGLFRAIEPIFGNYCSAIGTSFATASRWTRTDNTIAYRSPTVGGLTGYAMYSFKASASDGSEGKKSSERYASAALRWLGGPAEVVFVADATMPAKEYSAAQVKDPDTGYTVTVGGNYTFENGVKLIAFAQSFSDMNLNWRTQGTTGTSVGTALGLGGYSQVDGWGAGIGAHCPLFGGTAKVTLNHREMDNTDNTDFTRWTAAAAYDYSLSKRTSVYAMTGYTREKVEVTSAKSVTPSGYEFCFGLLHRF